MINKTPPDRIEYNVFPILYQAVIICIHIKTDARAAVPAAAVGAANIQAATAAGMLTFPCVYITAKAILRPTVSEQLSSHLLRSPNASAPQRAGYKARSAHFCAVVHRIRNTQKPSETIGFGGLNIFFSPASGRRASQRRCPLKGMRGHPQCAGSLSRGNAA